MADQPGWCEQRREDRRYRRRFQGARARSEEGHVRVGRQADRQRISTTCWTALGRRITAGNAVAAAPAPVPAAGAATIRGTDRAWSPKLKPDPTRGVEIGAADSPIDAGHASGRHVARRHGGGWIQENCGSQLPSAQCAAGSNSNQGEFMKRFLVTALLLTAFAPRRQTAREEEEDHHSFDRYGRTAMVIPKEAVLGDDGSYHYTDKQGKNGCTGTRRSVYPRSRTRVPHRLWRRWRLALQCRNDQSDAGRRHGEIRTSVSVRHNAIGKRRHRN